MAVTQPNCLIQYFITASVDVFRPAESFFAWPVAESFFGCHTFSWEESLLALYPVVALSPNRFSKVNALLLRGLDSSDGRWALSIR